MKKKIAICDYYMGMGGTEKALLALFSALDPNEFDVTLYLLFNEGALAKDVPEWVNVELIPFVNEKYRAFVASRIPYPWFKEKRAKVTRKLVKMQEKVSFENGELFKRAIQYCSPVDIEYDVVLDFYGYGSFTTVWTREVLKGKKYATWLHDSLQEWTKRTEYMYSKFDKIFAVSQAALETFVDAHENLRDRTELFLNIIDCSKAIAKSNEKDEEAVFDIPTIVTVGRVCEQKGQDMAFKAAAILQSRGVVFKWVFVGPSDHMDKYQKLIRDNKVESCVKLLGLRKNPYPYMKNATIYAQPSRHEGYCITLIEARCINCPIIATDIQCNKEQIIDGETGYLVPFDENEFADKIEFLLNNPEKREELKNNLESKTIDFSSELHKLLQLL